MDTTNPWLIALPCYVAGLMMGWLAWDIYHNWSSDNPDDEDGMWA